MHGWIQLCPKNSVSAVAMHPAARCRLMLSLPRSLGHQPLHSQQLQKLLAYNGFSSLGPTPLHQQELQQDPQPDSQTQQQQQQPQNGHHQQQQPQNGHQRQQQPSTPKQLSWQELHRAAQIAAWSGLCYQLPQDLQERIQQQHLQLTLVAHGRNEYTAWYVADGIVPHAHFCTTVRQRTTGSSSGRNSSSGGSTGMSSIGAAAKGGSQEEAVRVAADADAAGGSAGSVDVCEVSHGKRERFVFMRGVQWSAHDVDSVKLSQALMRMWPTPFPQTLPYPPNKAASISNASSSSSSSSSSAAGSPSSPLVAHQGVAEVAESMFDQLRPYFDQADDVGMPICFAGHSLGGSLAMLTFVLYQLHSRRRRPGTNPCCYTFGSPPVLAHETGGGGHRALQALGLPQDSIKNFVLENDPVPRALLSVDPTFELMKGWGAVRGLLQLRGLLAGEGSPLSSDRFLFESVGQVHLIKWTPEGGSEVVPLDAHEIESELSFLAPKSGTQQQQPPTPAKHSPTSSTPSTNATATAATAATSASAIAGSAGPAAAAAAAADAGGWGGITAALSQLVSPLRGVQAWLDHHHGSYAQELEAAALRGIKRQVAQQQQTQQQAQQQ